MPDILQLNLHREFFAQITEGTKRIEHRTLELPGANPLKDAHAPLDTAVLTAYGFSAKKDLRAQLLALNQQVAAKIQKGEPVIAPGVRRIIPSKEARDGGLHQAESAGVITPTMSAQPPFTSLGGSESAGQKEISYRCNLPQKTEKER